MDLRGQQGYNLGGAEACISEASKDAVDGVERLRDEQIRGRLSGCGATEKELKLRSTRAVADSDCASELDAANSVSFTGAESIR